MKSSTTWNGNAIAQSPRKMSEFRDISNTSDIRFLMVYRTIIDVILHLFIIYNDLWCQLPFFHKLSVITEALFSVRCLRCVVVARLTATSQSSFVLARTQGTVVHVATAGGWLTRYRPREVRNSIYRYRKIHIDYRSKFLYRFISPISIIYANTTVVLSCI